MSGVDFTGFLFQGNKKFNYNLVNFGRTLVKYFKKFLLIFKINKQYEIYCKKTEVLKKSMAETTRNIFYFKVILYNICFVKKLTLIK